MEKREQLKPLAAEFFKINPDVPQIFVTTDNHIWYVELHAIRHQKRTNAEYYKYTPSSLVEEKEELTPKQKAQQEADSLGIEYKSNISVKKLEEMIEAKKLEDLKLEAIDLEVDYEDDISYDELLSLVNSKK